MTRSTSTIASVITEKRIAPADSTSPSRSATDWDQHESPWASGLSVFAGSMMIIVGVWEALTGFAQAQMPMEVAHSRLALASAIAAERPEVALSEARAALDAFERFQAARDADAAGALLRSLGARPASTRTSGVLTKREAEVLELLGHGLSNPEISDRLYISRKTVEHHVGNILAKLGLRSRGEASAYAHRAKPGSE